MLYISRVDLAQYVISYILVVPTRVLFKAIVVIVTLPLSKCVDEFKQRRTSLQQYFHIPSVSLLYRARLLFSSSFPISGRKAHPSSQSTLTGLVALVYHHPAYHTNHLYETNRPLYALRQTASYPLK